MKKDGKASKIGTWLFHNHFLMTLLIGGIAIGFIAFGDWRADAKHIPSCKTILIDIDAGTVSDLPPSASPSEIMDKFPCYTGDTKEGSSYNEGGGVFCKHHELFFYTQADRIEIQKGFDGDIAGIEGTYTLEAFVGVLGDPKSTRNETIVEAGAIYDSAYNFSMPYGSLTLFGREGHIQALHIENQTGEQGAADQLPARGESEEL